MTSINDRLNSYIEVTHDRPQSQADEIKRLFEQSTYKDFLSKIHDHQEFFMTRSNSRYQLVVSHGKVKISEVIVYESEEFAGSFFPFNHIRRSVVKHSWPREANFIVKINQSDEIEVEVEVNSAVKDVESLLRFVDFELFESK